MEQPDYSDLERRVAKLEDERGDIIHIAREGLRLSKLHALNLQQVHAIVGRNELNLGTALERLDRIEQGMGTMATKEDISAIQAVQAEHSERFDGIEAMLRQLLGRSEESP